MSKQSKKQMRVIFLTLTPSISKIKHFRQHVYEDFFVIIMQKISP